MKRKKLYKRKSVRAVSLLLAALAVTFICTTAFASGFTDLPQNHWAYSAISQATEDGVINGVGNGMFDPNGTVTLAQFLVILTRTYWPDEIAANRSTGPWYAKNYGVASDHDLFRVLYTPGVQEEYDYNDPITRAMMAQLVCNAMLANGAENVSDIPSVLQQIPDVSPSHQFAEGIAFCYSRGILQGVDKAGNFSPEGTLTRAQTATIYLRCKNALAGNSEQHKTPVTSDDSFEELTAEVIRLVNAERAKEGLAPLGTYGSLTKTAQLRASELVTLFSHERPNNTSCFTALDETGASKNAFTMGENIAAGSSTAAAVVEQWMNSPGHKDNIMNPDFTHIGVGYQPASSGYGHYWVQMFVGSSSVPD